MTCWCSSWCCRSWKSYPFVCIPTWWRGGGGPLPTLHSSRSPQAPDSAKTRPACPCTQHSLCLHLSLSLSLSLSNHFYYHSTLSTALLCQVWESWRGFHLLLIICGQIGNCILSSLDDKMLPRSSPVFALV